jgi:hypothetical protein
MSSLKIKDYLYTNLSTVFWSCFLVLGGAIFVSYYNRINYMPEFDFASAVTILAAASVTAFFLVALFTISMIIPGVFWVETWANETGFKHFWENDAGEKKPWLVAGWFWLPIFFWYGLFIIGALGFVTYALLLLLLACCFFYFLYKKTAFDKKVFMRESWKFIFTSICCALLAFLPIYTVSILMMSDIETTKGSSTFVGVLVAVAIIVINLAVIMKRKTHNGAIYYPVLGLLAFFILFSAFEIFHRIPERVMEIYKFGAIKNASVVFKSEACLPLKMQGVIQSFEAEAPCKVSELTILSRLGEEFYIEKDKIRIAINKSDVISWAVGKPDA